MFFEMALHSDGKQIMDEVYKNIRDMSRFSDGILLLYGLCGNSLGDIGNDLRDLSCPIYFLTDKDDKRVDDCIAVALGGNKQYEETLSGSSWHRVLLYSHVGRQLERDR